MEIEKYFKIYMLAPLFILSMKLNMALFILRFIQAIIKIFSISNGINIFVHMSLGHIKDFSAHFNNATHGPRTIFNKSIIKTWLKGSFLIKEIFMFIFIQFHVKRPMKLKSLFCLLLRHDTTTLILSRGTNFCLFS